MEGSRTPLRLWFQAIYLHTQPQCVNALQLSSIINVTYKTAWLICHKIRHAMSRAESEQILTGVVRVSDSVYCRRLTTSFDWHKQEQPLLIGTSDNENGEIETLIIKHQSKKTLRDKYDCPDTAPFIRDYVDPQAATRATITRRYGKKYGQETGLDGKQRNVVGWENFSRYWTETFTSLPRSILLFVESRQYCLVRLLTHRLRDNSANNISNSN